MFRALFTHPQEKLHKRHFACVLCQLAAPGLEFHSNIQSAVCATSPEDEQVMLETRRGS
jgi:hypothetical protein